jgi:hypothetical protein
MKIDAVVYFTASASVQFEVPDDTPLTFDGISTTIQGIVANGGLPEVLGNPSINFEFAESCQVKDFESPEDSGDTIEFDIG